MCRRCPKHGSARCKGSIIAKCTLYVNKKYGYVVINDFEINSKYKKNELHDEDDCIISGYYSDEIDSPQRHERDLIFNTFMRGIKAFVSEYDKQNPNNPIRQVNVGLGHNRLQEQCEQFKVATSLLKVPSAYCFQDAQQMQCILYKKEEIGEINNTVENIK